MSLVAMALLLLALLPTLWVVVCAICACIVGGRSDRSALVVLALVFLAAPGRAQEGSSAYACNAQSTVCVRLMEACDAGPVHTFRVYNYSQQSSQFSVTADYASNSGPQEVPPGEYRTFTNTLANGFSNICALHQVNQLVGADWVEVSSALRLKTRHGTPTTGACLGENCQNPLSPGGDGGDGDNGDGGGSGGGGPGGSLYGAHWCQDALNHGGCTRSINPMEDSAILQWWKKLTVPCECMVYETLERLEEFLTWGPLGMIQTLVSWFDPPANQPEPSLPTLNIRLPYVQAEQPNQGTYGNARLRADDGFHFMTLDLNPYRETAGFAWLRTLLGISVWISFVMFVWKIIIPRMTF